MFSLIFFIKTVSKNVDYVAENLDGLIRGESFVIGERNIGAGFYGSGRVAHVAVGESDFAVSHGFERRASSDVTKGPIRGHGSDGCGHGLLLGLRIGEPLAEKRLRVGIECGLEKEAVPDFYGREKDHSGKPWIVEASGHHNGVVVLHGLIVDGLTDLRGFALIKVIVRSGRRAAGKSADYEKRGNERANGLHNSEIRHFSAPLKD